MALIIFSDLCIYLEKDYYYNTVYIVYQLDRAQNDNGLLVHKRELDFSCQQSLAAIARDPHKYCLNGK